MLSRNSYEQTYVDECRRTVDAQVRAYQDLVATAREGASDDRRIDRSIATFEAQFFATMVLALDATFMHRGRGIEGKDGNPLNEVRMLCTSITQHGGVLAADTTIKYRPESSVLGCGIGGEITLDEDRFARLAEAFLAEIEQRFV